MEAFYAHIPVLTLCHSPTHNPNPIYTNPKPKSSQLNA